MTDDTSKIKEQVDARVKEEAVPPKDNTIEITTEFISGCLMANELGDGMLFAAMHKGQYVFNKTGNCWLKWVGHYWKYDVLEEVYTAVEEVAVKYNEAAIGLDEDIKEISGQKDQESRVKSLKKKQATLFTRARRLRSVKGAANCLLWSHRLVGGLGIKGEEFDRNDWLLACNNGVINLKTGTRRDGHPEDYITKAVPHDWTGIDTPAPKWKQFLSEVFLQREEIVEFTQRLFGYGITGDISEHAVVILYGEGRNGKGTLIEQLNYNLGEISQPIQSEMLLDQKINRSSSAPSPDVMTLFGLRFAMASETDEGRKFSVGKIKLYSGGDTLNGRNPHDKHETKFKPTHLLCLLTNHLPHAPADDYGFWQRLHVIPFDAKFVAKPSKDKDNEFSRNKDLPGQLQREASGILAWLVKGCIKWQREGLNPPPAITKAVKAYQSEEDVVGAFIEENCVVEDGEKIQYTTICEEFEKWFEEYRGGKIPSRRWFAKLVEKRFKKAKDGNIFFYGLRLNEGLDGLMD